MNSRFNFHLSTKHVISRIPLNLIDPYLLIIKNNIMPLTKQVARQFKFCQDKLKPSRTCFQRTRNYSSLIYPIISDFLTGFILKFNFRDLKCNRKWKNLQIKYKTLVLPNMEHRMFLYLCFQPEWLKSMAHIHRERERNLETTTYVPP